MKSLSIRDLRAKLGQLDKVLGQEQEIIITRRGKPVARLLPVERPRDRPSHRALRDALSAVSVPSEVLQRDEREARE